MNQKAAEQAEQRIRSREQSLNSKTEGVQRREQELETIKQNLNRQLEVIAVKKGEFEKQQEEHINRLESVSKLTQSEAKSQLIESLKGQAQSEAMGYVKVIMDEAKLKANKEAKKIVIQTIQRVAAEHAIENSISSFHIDSDDVKVKCFCKGFRSL